MDRADILAWLETTRATAKTQMERWQGVDPSRLLEACDLVEQLLQPNAPALSEPHPAPYVPPIDDSIRAGEIAEQFSREWSRLRRGLHAIEYQGDGGFVVHRYVPDPALSRRPDTILDVELGRYLRVARSARDSRIRATARGGIERIEQEAYQVLYQTTDPHQRAYAQSLIEQIDTARAQWPIEDGAFIPR